MSKKKKHKKKFRAQLHQAMQEIQRDNSASTEEPKNLRAKEQKPISITTNEERKEQELKSEPAKLSEAAPPKINDKKTEKIPDEYVYVKKDVLKIVMIMSVCIVLLVTIWILSLKTSYVSNFANSLANFSHLSQGE